MTKIICELISGCCDDYPVGELNNDYDGSWGECRHCGDRTTFHCNKLVYGHSCDGYYRYPEIESTNIETLLELYHQEFPNDDIDELRNSARIDADLNKILTVTDHDGNPHRTSTLRGGGWQ